MSLPELQAPIAISGKWIRNRRNQRWLPEGIVEKGDLDTIALFDDTRGMGYDGGKGQDGVYQRIINQMPPHDLYLEPFLGQGSLLRHKRPSRMTVGIDRDPAVLEFWQQHPQPGLYVHIGDGMEYLESHSFLPNTLIYCDPPYVASTRRQHRPIYRYELEDSDHERLLKILIRLDCLVMVSGYWSELYADHLRNWRSISFQAVTRGGSLATEWLWCNFPEPTELHDYRYLGANFRDRERIKRKKARWVNRLRSMPTLERQALSAALAEVGEG